MERHLSIAAAGATAIIVTQYVDNAGHNRPLTMRTTKVSDVALRPASLVVNALRNDTLSIETFTVERVVRASSWQAHPHDRWRHAPTISLDCS